MFSRREDEKELYEEDLTDIIPSGDSLASVTKKESSGVTVDSTALSSNTLQVVVSSGSSGYTISKVTTTAGKIFEIIFEFNSPEGVSSDAYA